MEFHPGYLVCDVLKKIACCTNASKECLCKVSIFNVRISLLHVHWFHVEGMFVLLIGTLSSDDDDVNENVRKQYGFN